MKFLVFFALCSVLSVAFCDTWVDLPASDIDDFEVNQALNFGASNLTQDAIAKGHLPEGTYRISNIESAQKKVDDDDLDDNNEVTDLDDYDNDYRFVVEITNDEGSTISANYTVHVDVDYVNGEKVYSFYVSQYVYNWATSESESEFGEDEFEWVYENEWYEFCEAEDDGEESAEGAVEGSESVADASDEADSQVIVVQEDGEAEWVSVDTLVVSADETSNDLSN